MVRAAWSERPVTSEGVAVVDLISDLADDALATLATVSLGGRRVRRVTIFDAASVEDVRSGDLVLAVGVPAVGEQALALITALARADVAAVVLRGAEQPAMADAVAACESARIALVVTRPALSWERTYSHLHAAVSSRSLRLADSTETVPLGDMFKLATALSELVGGPTIVEDAFFRVIGYSAYAGVSDRGRQSAILSRQVPPEWLAYLRERGILEGLRTTDEIFRLDDGPADARPRLITSVRAEDAQIGVIWVAQGDHELDDEAVDRLREGKRIAEPHFRRYLALDRLGDRHRSEILRAFLESRESDPTISAALALAHQSQYCLIAFKVAVDRARLGQLDLIPALLETFDRRAAVTTLNDIVYGWVPISAVDDTSRLKGVAQQLITGRRGGRPRELVDSIAVISSPHWLSTGAAAAREEIRTLLSLADERSERPCLLTGWEAEAEILTTRAEKLLKLDGRFDYKPVRLLKAHDDEHGTQLCATLAAYLTYMRDIGKASDALGVHQTTTRYRLQQVTRLSGLRLDEPEQRLAALLHLVAAGALPLHSLAPGNRDTMHPTPGRRPRS